MKINYREIGQTMKELGSFFKIPGVLRSRVPGTELVEGKADESLGGLSVVAGGDLRATFSVVKTHGINQWKNELRSFLDTFITLK